MITWWAAFVTGKSGAPSKFFGDRRVGRLAAIGVRLALTAQPAYDSHSADFRLNPASNFLLYRNAEGNGVTKESFPA